MLQKALLIITQFAVTEFALTRIYTIPFLHNLASIKVLEKAGYQREGIMRRSAVKDGQIIDQVMYAYMTDS